MTDCKLFANKQNERGSASSHTLILFLSGDHAGRDDPHALRDALANFDIVIILESGSTSIFYKPFKSYCFGS